MPNRFQLTIIAIVFLAPQVSVSARKPWKPQITVEPFECIGTGKARPFAENLQLFQSSYDKAKRLLANGQYKRARPHLAKARTLNPDHIGVRLEHARVLLTLGYLSWNKPLVEEASADIDHALAIRPQDSKLKQMATLLEGLIKRMNRVRNKKRKRKRKQRKGTARLKPNTEKRKQK